MTLSLMTDTGIWFYDGFSLLIGPQRFGLLCNLCQALINLPDVMFGICNLVIRSRKKLQICSYK